MAAERVSATALAVTTGAYWVGQGNSGSRLIMSMAGDTAWLIGVFGFSLTEEDFPLTPPIRAWGFWTSRFRGVCMEQAALDGNATFRIFLVYLPFAFFGTCKVSEHCRSSTTAPRTTFLCS